MFVVRKPTFTELKEYLGQHSDSPFTYAEVEGTRGPSPEGYSCGRSRVELGRGHPTFVQAKRSLQDWRMFPEGFVDLVWPGPIQAGRVVATLFRAPGVWTLNPCRIVYTIHDLLERDQFGPVREAAHQHPEAVLDRHSAQVERAFIERFGFAYGTVGDHLASGEERFTVEFDHSDESVWYEVYCFSKARHWLAKAAYPYLRLQQQRFRSLSGRAMRAAVRSAAVASTTAAV